MTADEITNMMTKEELRAYWNYSRVIKTIPEKAFETDPQVQQLANVYMALEMKYLQYLHEANLLQK